MTYFTDEQVKLLLARIHPNRVLMRDGMSYVEGYDIRAELTRVFGFGRWTSEVLDQAVLCEREVKTKEYTNPKTGEVKGGRPAWYVVYRSRVRLTIFAPDGTLVTFHDGSHVGESTHPVFGDAHGNALTNSETYALRRAAINLGDQFGLSLYNKGSLDPIVRWTLVRPEQAEAASTTDTDDVPQVSAEEPGAGSGGTEGATSAGSVFDNTEPAEPEHVTAPRDADEARAAVAVQQPELAPDPELRPDLHGRAWLDWALGQAYTLKDQEFAGKLWREAAAKVHSRELTPADAKHLQEVLNARVAELQKIEKAFARLDPDDDWTQRIKDIADGDDGEASRLLDEVDRTQMAAEKRHLLRAAITARFPQAGQESEEAA